jgi:SAM-dependent methyltransferase
LSVAGDLSGQALDIGCGNGAVLETLNLGGIGIDIDPWVIDLAKRRQLACTFLVGDARDIIPKLSFAPDVIINLGASQAIGSQTEALTAFADLLKPGGKLLFGDGIWDKEPSAEYLAFLGEEQSARLFADEFIVLGEQYGFQLKRSHVSTQSEWDSFEDHWYSTMIKWCDNHPSHPNSSPYRERMESWRKAYLSMGRGTLGFAMVLLEKV